MGLASTGSSFWRDRSTFVTGGTGLVGGWLVRRLIELEANVVCLVRDWIPHRHPPGGADDRWDREP